MTYIICDLLIRTGTTAPNGVTEAKEEGTEAGSVTAGGTVTEGRGDATHATVSKLLTCFHQACLFY